MAGQDQKNGGRKDVRIESDTPTLQPGETRLERLNRNFGRAGRLIYDVLVEEIKPLNAKLQSMGTDFRAAVATAKERKQAAEEAEKKFEEAKKELEGYENLRAELNDYKKKVEELIAIREGEKADYELRMNEIAYDRDQAKIHYERLFEAKTELLKKQYDEVTERLNKLELSQNEVVEGFEQFKCGMELFKLAMEETAERITQEHSSVSDEITDVHREMTSIRNSLTPAPKEGATDEVDSIDASPPPMPPPVEAVPEEKEEEVVLEDLSDDLSEEDQEETRDYDMSKLSKSSEAINTPSKSSIPPEAMKDGNGLSELLNENREELKEHEETIAELKEEIETAVELEEPAVVDELDVSKYEGYEKLGAAHGKTLKYLCKKRNEIRAHGAMLEVLYNATNRLLELEELPALAEVSETKMIALEKEEQQKLDNAIAVMLSKKSAKNIAEELKRQDEMISAIRAGLDGFYRKYEVGE